MKLEKGDFVKLDYVGKSNGKIFDLTKEKLAKEEGIYNEKTKYGPVTIVLGANHLIKGLDKALIGKEVGKEFEVEIKPEDGFGKKNRELLKILPEKTFKSQKITPVHGMQINIDGVLGTVISSSGGRVVIDFNHPLAGKVLNYKVKILKKVEDKKEKAVSLIELYTGKDKEDINVKIEEDKAEIKINGKIHDKLEKKIEEDMKKYIGLKELKFIKNKEKQQKKE